MTDLNLEAVDASSTDTYDITDLSNNVTRKEETFEQRKRERGITTNTSTPKTTRCFKCGNEEHFARDCPQNIYRDKACYTCGKMGHIARYCRASPRQYLGKGQLNKNHKNSSNPNFNNKNKHQCPRFSTIRHSVYNRQQSFPQLYRGTFKIDHNSADHFNLTHDQHFVPQYYFVLPFPIACSCSCKCKKKKKP